MMIAVALFSIAAASAQDETISLISTKWADMHLKIKDTEEGGLISYPFKMVYTFSNTKPVNVRQSVWIPCDSYGNGYPSEVFGYNCNSSEAQASSAGMLMRVNHIPQGIVFPVNRSKQQNVKFTGDMKLRSTAAISSLEITAPPAYADLSEIHYSVSLDTRKEWLKEDNAFPIWTSESISFEAGTENEATFEWDGYSNRDGIRRIIDDEVIFVFENADTGEILEIAYFGSEAFCAYGNMTIEIDGITDQWVATKDMPEIAMFIISDWQCNFLPDDAIRDGVEGILKFFDSECNNGVIAYAATGHDKEGKPVKAGTIEGTIKANTVTQVTYHLVPGPNYTGLMELPGGVYHVVDFFVNSYNPEEYTVGRKFPLFGYFGSDETFPQGFKLGIPSGIKTPSVDEVKVIWKGDTPYLSVNGQEIKADIYDLTGKKVQFVERSKFYIVQARTADGKKYAQIVIR